MILAHFSPSDAASFLLVGGLGFALWTGSRRQWRPTLAGVAVAMAGVVLSLLHPAP